MTKGPNIDEFLDAVRDEGVGPHSPLWVYMHDNHDDLARRIEGGTTFTELTAAFERMGKGDRNGNVASYHVVYQTWGRVKRLVADQRAKTPSPKPPKREWPLGPGEIAPGVRPVAQPPAPATAVSSAPVRMDGVLDELGAQRPWMPKRGG